MYAYVLISFLFVVVVILIVVVDLDMSGGKEVGNHNTCKSLDPVKQSSLFSRGSTLGK